VIHTSFQITYWLLLQERRPCSTKITNYWTWTTRSKYIERGSLSVEMAFGESFMITKGGDYQLLVTAGKSLL